MNFKMRVVTNYKGQLLLAGQIYNSEKLKIPDDVVERWNSRKICKIQAEESFIPIQEKELETKPIESDSLFVSDQQVNEAIKAETDTVKTIIDEEVREKIIQEAPVEKMLEIVTGSPQKKKAPKGKKLGKKTKK